MIEKEEAINTKRDQKDAELAPIDLEEDAKKKKEMANGKKLAGVS